MPYAARRRSGGEIAVEDTLRLEPFGIERRAQLGGYRVGQMRLYGNRTFAAQYVGDGCGASRSIEIGQRH